MILNTAFKAQAISILLRGPVSVDDERMGAVYILKREGSPIITELVNGRLKHRLVETSLDQADVIRRRARGLDKALGWHKSEPQSKWGALLETIDCVFARDEAAEYLRSIVQRSRVVESLKD